jgi:hypothetical protein
MRMWNARNCRDKCNKNKPWRGWSYIIKPRLEWQWGWRWSSMQDLDPGTSEDVVMDNLDTLQDVCTMFYANAQCNKLAATLTLMNMCTIHGYSNKFVDEFFLYCTNFCCLWTTIYLIACMVPKHWHNILAWNITKFMHVVLDYIV